MITKVIKNVLRRNYGIKRSKNKPRILNELGVVQETKMKERELLNKINKNKKAKTRLESGNLTMGSIIR